MILSSRLNIQEVDTDTDIGSFPAEISKLKKLPNKEKSLWSRIDVVCVLEDFFCFEEYSHTPWIFDATKPSFRCIIKACKYLGSDKPDGLDGRRADAEVFDGHELDVEKFQVREMLLRHVGEVCEVKRRPPLLRNVRCACQSRSFRRRYLGLWFDPTSYAWN